MTMADAANLEAPLAPVIAHGVTHVGCVRQTNEDALYWDVGSGVYVVADGMGGHSAGEVASRLAVDTVCDFLQRSREDDSLTWPFGIDPALTSDGNRLATAVRLANRRVFTAAEAEPGRAGMGTTVVAALVDNGTVTFCSVGDSRLYVFRDGQLTQLTRDDTWLATLVTQGGADPAELQQHPMRHMLTEAVGTMQDVHVVVEVRPFSPGETLLLCSDGLHSMITDADIVRVLGAAPSADPEQACAALLDAALQAGARDNVTALVLRRR